MRKSVFAFLLLGYMSEHQIGCKEVQTNMVTSYYPPATLAVAAERV